MGLSTLHNSPSPPDLEVGGGIKEYLRTHRAALGKVEMEFLSEADGRNLNVAGRYEFEPDEPKLIVRVGGSLAQVKMGLSGSPGGGTRGEVLGFSSASRRRLMRLIASLDRGERPVFVTLTYPDAFPDDREKWKRDIDVFGKRLARMSAEAGFLWRIEFKERRSGVSKGEVAPHFHLLVYGVPYATLRGWVAENWWGVVGSGDSDHLSAGTRVERVYSFGGIMRYVGKYIAKEDEYPVGWTGRVWGVVGRKNLPWAVEVVISLTDEQAIKLTRMARKLMGIGRKSFNFGVTWIANVERVLDYLEYLIGFP